GDSDRSNVADDTDDFDRHTQTCHEQSFADRIFVRKNFFRAGLADQAHILSIGHVMLVELASRQERNAPSPKIFRRNMLARPVRALLDWWNIPIGTRIERSISSS